MVQRLANIFGRFYGKIVSSVKNDWLFRNLLKNSSYLFSATVIANGIGFAQAIVLARYLGVEQYGLLALILSYVTIVNQFFDFRIFEFMTKYVSEYWANGENKKALATVKLGYSIDFVSSGLAVIATVALARFAAKTIFHHPEMASVALIYAFSLLAINVNRTSTSIFQVFDRFSWVAGLRSGQSIFNFSLIVTTVILGWGLSGIILCYLITALLVGIVSLCLAMKIVHKELGRLSTGKISMLKGRLKEKGMFLFYTNMTGFMTMFLVRFDELVLGYFRGPTEVGWYKMAKNFATLFISLTDPISNALYPQLAKLWALERKREIKGLVWKVSKSMTILAVIIITSIMLLAPVAIKLFVGSDYLNSVVALRIMIWQVIWVVMIWAGILVMSAGRPDLFFKVNIFATFVCVAILILMTRIFGLVGTSIGFVSYTITWMIAMVYVCRRHREFLFGSKIQVNAISDFK